MSVWPPPTAYLFPFFGSIAWQEIYLYSICEFMPLFLPGKMATMPGEIHFGAVASMGQEAGYVRSALGENVSGIRGSGANLMGLLRAKRVDILIRGFRRDSKEQIVEKYI